MVMLQHQKESDCIQAAVNCLIRSRWYLQKCDMLWCHNK